MILGPHGDLLLNKEPHVIYFPWHYHSKVGLLRVAEDGVILGRHDCIIYESEQETRSNIYVALLNGAHASIHLSAVLEIRWASHPFKSVKNLVVGNPSYFFVAPNGLPSTI